MFRPAPPPEQAEPNPTPPAERPEDLGLSGVFEAESRFLKRDGSFNARRVGLGLAAYNPYTVLLLLSWPQFFAAALALYLLLNGLFAALYFVLGPGALSDSPSRESRLLADFFFSVQTFGTIGFGHVYPVTRAANVVVTLEAFVGLMAVALVTGMLFARFSRPSQRILFSQHAVIAPYRGGHALMFRVMNGQRGELSDVSVEVVATIRSGGEAAQPGRSRRRFQALALERRRVTLFPLTWTVVHPIDADSPLRGLDQRALLRQDAEVIAIVRATDETTRQSVQARTSYHARELRWGEKFSPMDVHDRAGLAVDARLLHATQPAELPLPPSADAPEPGSR